MQWNSEHTCRHTHTQTKILTESVNAYFWHLTRCLCHSVKSLIYSLTSVLNMGRHRKVVLTRDSICKAGHLFRKSLFGSVLTVQSKDHLHMFFSNWFFSIFSTSSMISSLICSSAAWFSPLVKLGRKFTSEQLAWKVSLSGLPVLLWHRDKWGVSASKDRKLQIQSS